MYNLRSTFSLICIVLLFPLHLISQDYENQKPFFTELEKKLIEEYHTCTGDTGNTDISYILRWKNSINLRIEDPAYKKILKEFILHSGLVKDIIPCEVLKWNQDRLSFIRSQESAMKSSLVEKADSTVDSFAIHMELSRNPTSPFDFDTIPFGISKDLFRKIFIRRYTYPITNMGKYLVVEHFPLRGSFFIAKFFFTREQTYYKYELEGYGISGDSLNTVIWPQAKRLKDNFVKKFGTPDELNRVGFFDIKADTASTYAQWNRDPFVVSIGIGIKENLYYTLVSITNNGVKIKKKK